MADMIPVYLFTGFLESGKTRMIQESMENEKFNNGQKTMIIQCEEGEEELDLSEFAGKNCYFELIENEADINPKKLTELAKKHKLDRVIIEYNGMWQIGKLYESLPSNWAVFQEVMFADANTFISYNNNMRSLMVDKLMGCEMVVLNRTPANIDKQEIHKLVRGISRRAQITYDYPDGHVEYDDIEDPLPFDINADIIEIKDEDYALWYRDMVEDTDKYHGKTVTFKGIVAGGGKLPKNGVVVGRHVMTCCADDIAYHGLVCNFTLPTDLKTRDWVQVTARISVENHKIYGDRPGPVLYALSYSAAAAPEQEVATFY